MITRYSKTSTLQEYCQPDEAEVPDNTEVKIEYMVPGDDEDTILYSDPEDLEEKEVELLKQKPASTAVVSTLKSVEVRFK